MVPCSTSRVRVCNSAATEGRVPLICHEVLVFERRAPWRSFTGAAPKWVSGKSWREAEAYAWRFPVPKQRSKVQQSAKKTSLRVCGQYRHDTTHVAPNSACKLDFMDSRSWLECHRASIFGVLFYADCPRQPKATESETSTIHQDSCLAQ
jgi:hypothetical protein